MRIRNPIYTVARQQAYFTVALPGVKPNQTQLNGTTSCIGLCPKLPRYTRRSAYNNSQRFARHLVVCAFECRIINRTLELCFMSASNTGPTVCHRQLCPSYSPRETYSITCCIYTVTSQSLWSRYDRHFVFLYHYIMREVKRRRFIVLFVKIESV